MSRIWPKVKIAGLDECWDWQGTKTKAGYAVTTTGRKRRIYVHRFLMERIHGQPVPQHLDVRHSCDRPCCVNPRHLSVGTRKDNVADMWKRGRAKITPLLGERNGYAVLTEDAVRDIRESYAAGATQTGLGQKYGVTQSAISSVVLRKHWRHVH